MQYILRRQVKSESKRPASRGSQIQATVKANKIEEDILRKQVFFDLQKHSPILGSIQRFQTIEEILQKKVEAGEY